MDGEGQGEGSFQGIVTARHIRGEPADLISQESRASPLTSKVLTCEFKSGELKC